MPKLDIWPSIRCWRSVPDIKIGRRRESRMVMRLAVVRRHWMQIRLKCLLDVDFLLVCRVATCLSEARYIVGNEQA